MSKGTSDAVASVLINLSEYEVLEVIRAADGGQSVVISTPVTEAACPECGALTSRVHQRTRQRLRDVPYDGLVEVAWVKKRW